MKTNDKGNLHFVFDKLSHVLSQKDYLKECLKEAGNRIEKDYDKEHSFFTAITFSSSDENLQRLRADLQELMEKYMGLGNAGLPSHRLAQANFQVFPISDPVDPANEAKRKTSTETRPLVRKPASLEQKVFFD